MADGSLIEWLQRPGTKPATWNPIRAYDKVSGKRGWFCIHAGEGCRYCWAEALNVRGGDTGGNGHAYIAQNLDKVRIELHEPTLLQPLKWRTPRTIFVCSTNDLFGHWVKEEWLNQIFAVASLCRGHTFIVVTKRPPLMRSFLSAPGRAHKIDGAAWSILGTRVGSKVKHGGDWRASLPLPNVWGLISVSTQPDADRDIPTLLSTPLAVRGISAEPLLGPIDLTEIKTRTPEGHAWMLDALTPDVAIEDGAVSLDWVIVGGESGKSARPMHPDWARKIIADCDAAGVAKFFKQWGRWLPMDQADDPLHEQCQSVGVWPGQLYDHRNRAYDLGKKASGRKLDGRTHDEFPGASVPA